MSTSRTQATAVQMRSADTLVPSADESGDPNEEAALLITCLRELPYLIPKDTNWKILLHLARENGVLLLVYQSMLATGAEMPTFFQDAARECEASAEQLASELEGMLREFHDLGVDVLPLKGPALALTLYGSVTLRSSNDLDLLVRHDDFPRCEALLLALGFTALGASSEHDRRFIRNGLLVELHFELASPRDFPFDVDRIWKRSRPSQFRGYPVRAMSDIDLVLYLCCHGLKHGFSRLIWIMDVARALRGWQTDTYRELAQQARQEGLEAHLLIACEVVRAMFPQQFPEDLDAVVAASPKAVERARHTALRLFSENREVVINDYRRLYLQAEPNTLKRWSYRLKYFVPTYSDYQWARRHRIQSIFMILVRPFRLLHKYGLRRAWQVAFPRR
jgi:hypothetical protein